MYFAHCVLVLAARAVSAARPVGVALTPEFADPTAQVICSCEIVIEPPAAPASGPAGATTLIVPTPALVVRIEPVTFEVVPVGFSFAGRWRLVFVVLVNENAVVAILTVAIVFTCAETVNAVAANDGVVMPTMAAAARAREMESFFTVVLIMSDGKPRCFKGAAR